MKNSSFQSNLLSSLGLPIMATDLDFNFTYWNKAAQRKFGWLETDVLGKNIVEYFEMDNALDFNQLILKLSTESNDSYEFLFKEKSGNKIPIAVTFSRLLNEESVFFGVTAVVVDITDNKSREEQFIQNEYRYKALIDNVNVGVFMSNLSGKLLFANQTVAQMAGYNDPDDFITGTAEKLYVNKADRELVINLLKTQGGFKNLEINTYKKDGTACWISLNSILLKNNEGVPDTILGISTEITERKTAEHLLKQQREEIEAQNEEYLQINEELRQLNDDMKYAKERIEESERNYREIFDASGDAIFIHDATTGLTVDVNNTMLQMYGYENKDEIINNSLVGMSAVDEGYSVEKANDLISKSLQADIKSFEWRARKKDGEKFWVDVKLKHVQIGGIQHIMATVRDISLQKNAEQILQDIVDKNPLSIQTVDKDGFSLTVNQAHTRLFGAVPPSFYNIFTDPQLHNQGLGEYLRRAHCGETIYFPIFYYNAHDFDNQFPDVPVWIRMVIFPVYGNSTNPECYVLMHENFTERKLAEEKVINLNRVYAFLSNINKTIVRVRQKQELFDQACEIAMESGKFQMAWFGIRNQMTGKVDVAATGGVTGNYLKFINIDLNDELRSNGPTGLAIRTGRYFVSNDIANDENMLPWKDKAAEFGYKSSIALPIMVDGYTIGAFNLYSNEINFFDELEIKLLNEIALDISFALEYYNKETNRIQADSLLLEKSHQIEAQNEEYKQINEELQQAKEKLEASETKYRTLIQYSSDPIFSFNPDETYKFVNEAFAKTVQKTPNEIIGKTPHEIFSFDEAERRLKLVRHVLKTGESGEIEVKIPHHKLGERCFLTAVDPIKNSLGKVLWVTCLSKDITERKNAELLLIQKNKEIEIQNEELHKAKQLADENYLKNKGLLIAIPDIMFLFNSQGVFLEFFASDYQELYVQADFFLQKHVSETMPPEIAALTLEKINKVLQTKEIEIYEYSLYMNNEIQYFESRMVFIDSEKTLAIVRNMSEKKKLMRDLIQAKEKAEESDRLKSAFLANMSHEIRTPMNGIVGFSELLLEPDITDDQKRKFVEIINTNSYQLLGIINDIIDISKIELGLITPNLTDVNINKLMADIETIVKPNALRKNLSLFHTRQLTDNQSIILADDIKLRQIFTNLLTNAIKFTSKGIIEFGYSLKNEFLEFYVHDTGCGVPKEKAELIFERFRQLENQPEESRTGTGLGLAITKAYVQLLDGKIWLESEEDKGTSFYFTIPYKPINIIAGDLSGKSINTYNWSNKTILIAEDDYFNFLFIKNVIAKTQATILHAENGKIALQIFNSNPTIDLILMDIKMPYINGLEATETIRKTNQKIPIIAQTAYAFSDDEKQAKLAGCNDYLSKPIKSQKLLQMIEHYLSTV